MYNLRMRNKLYTERFEICLTPEQKLFLRKRAKKLNLTIAQLIRHLIEDSLN